MSSDNAAGSEAAYSAPLSKEIGGMQLDEQEVCKEDPRSRASRSALRETEDGTPRDDGDDDQHSAECSSVGTHSCLGGGGSATVGSLPTPSPTTTAVGLPPPAAPPRSIASWDGAQKKSPDASDDSQVQQTSDEEHVTINLSSGEDLFAKPYENSVSGHHVMLQQEGLIWKATRSHREERFYVTMRYCLTENEQDRPRLVASSPTTSSQQHQELRFEEEEDRDAARTIQVTQILGHAAPDDELILSARALAPYVPKFFGMRQVRKLRCAHDLHTPGSVAGSSDFPSTPRSAEDKYDAAARHSAEELVASFQSQLQSSGGGSKDSSYVSNISISHPSLPPPPPALQYQPPQSMPTTALAPVSDDAEFSSQTDLEVSPQVPTAEKTDGMQEADEGDPFLACGDSWPSAATGTVAGREADQADVVEDSQHSQAPPTSANLALRRNTLLPAKAPEQGRPLDHNLPRTADQLVDMIVLEDVCRGFLYPCVLDIKMGSRQYGVNAPVEKRRSKTEKAKRSASSSLGLRVSGYKRWNPKAKVFEAKGKRECFSFSTSQIEATLLHFFGGDAQLIAKFHRIVREFEEAFVKQTAFRFFTSSVLLVFDGERPHDTARLAMVDFAYTYRKTELVAANDEDAQEGNDVGYLRGIESLGCMLGHVLSRCLQQSCSQ